MTDIVISPARNSDYIPSNHESENESVNSTNAQDTAHENAQSNEVNQELLQEDYILPPDVNTSQLGPIRTQNTIGCSAMHSFFTINKTRSICKTCKKVYSPTTSTGTLKKHIETKHFHMLQQYEQTKLNFPIIDPYNSYEQQQRTKLLMEWIILSQQSSSIVG